MGAWTGRTVTLTVATGLALVAAGCADSGNCTATANCAAYVTGDAGADGSAAETGAVDSASAGPDGGSTDATPADSAPGGSDGGNDATGSDATPPMEAGSTCGPGVAFGSPSPVSALNGPMATTINTQAALSPDLLTVYFESNRLGMGLNMFTASRASAQSTFGSVAPLSSLNFSGADTWNATLTGDGLTAYLVTDQGGADHMYVTTRASSLASFGQPALMPSPIVSGEQPFVRADGQVLYYTNEIGPGYTIMRATLGATPVAAAVALGSTGTPDVGVPVIDPTETVLYFAAFDHASVDSYDIWTSTRASTSDPWGTPVPVTAVNTTTFDAPSWVSPDGCILYLSHVDSGGNYAIEVAVKP